MKCVAFSELPACILPIIQFRESLGANFINRISVRDLAGEEVVPRGRLQDGPLAVSSPLSSLWSRFVWITDEALGEDVKCVAFSELPACILPILQFGESVYANSVDGISVWDLAGEEVVPRDFFGAAL